MTFQDEELNLSIYLSEQESDGISGTIEKEWVHLFFNVGVEIEFGFGPVYKRTLNSGKVFLIYNPDESIKFNIPYSPQLKLVYLKIPLAHLHNFFVPDSQQAPIFKTENIKRKFYEEKEIHSSLYIVLHHLIETPLNQNLQKLYLRAKGMEILSLFFSEKNIDTEHCPFLNNDQVIRKLKRAKDILYEEFKSPPTIPELSKQVGLNEFQLKAGFKKMYGNSPYQFLLEYKLNKARQLLLSGNYQVNEVADLIGYQNTSHFIDAFKRKFGITPKKSMN